MRLVTERLTIRKFQPGDAVAFAAYRSDVEVARYQSWDTPLTLAEAEATVRRYGSEEPGVGWFQYAIDLGGTLVGDLGVNTHPNRMQAEIGFTLAPLYQGQGYASEAVRRIIGHLFEHHRMHRISAGCDPRNRASARLLERVGFRREGWLRGNAWLKGEWTDELVFGLLRGDRVGHG